MERQQESVNTLIFKAYLSQFIIRSTSVGWLTPETAKQTACTQKRVEPAFERALAMTSSRASLAALSVERYLLRTTGS